MKYNTIQYKCNTMQIQIQIQAVVRWQWYDSLWHSPRDKGSALRPSLQLHSTQLLDLFHNQANNDSQVLFNSTLPNSWKSPLCNPPTLHLCRSNISIQYWRRSPPSHYFVFETLRTASHYLKLVCCLLFFIYGRGQLTYTMLYSIKSVGRRELTYAFLCAAIRVLRV